MEARIVLLDDIEDLRELTCMSLELSLPIQCLKYSSVEELREAHSKVLDSQVALIDLELGPGQPNGIDAYRWFQEKHYSGKIFFFTGHGRYHPLVQEALKFGADLLEKPMRMDELALLVEKFLPQGSKNSSPEACS